MKLLLFPALLLAALPACTVNVDDGLDDTDDSQQEMREVGAYQRVTNRGDAQVEMVGDESGDGLSPGDVLVVCEGGLVADVETTLDSSGGLVIEMAGEVASILGCQVKVVVEGVEEVVNEGDGDVVCEGTMPDVRTLTVSGNGSVDLATVEADELTILVTGNGAISIANVQVQMLNIDLRGAGDATLAGNTVDADLQISGNGDLRAKDLTVAETLTAVLNGTGNAVITVLGTVNAEVQGDATLEVYGGALPGILSEVDGGEVIFY